MKRNFWKKTAAFTLALTLAAGAMPASTPMQDLFSGAVVTAHAEVTASGFCGADTNEGGAESVTWTLEDGKLTISGTGAMADFQPNGMPWSSQESSITQVEIVDGVTSIGESAFYGCSSLNSVTIQDSVTSIGKTAFYDCTALSSVRVECEIPPTISSDTFTNTPDNMVIYLPRPTIMNYLEYDNNWKKLIRHVVPFNPTSGYCGDPEVNERRNLTWSLEDGTLTISGTGAIRNNWANQIGWQCSAASIKRIVIEEGVTA